MRRLAEAHDQAWIVAPETGGVLAALRDAVGAERLIGCGAHAIRVASRKRATLEALAAHGVLTPLDFAGVAARWVVKPDDGAGAADTRVHASRAAAEADLQARQRGRVRHTRALGGGRGALRALLAGAQGAEAVAFNRQDIHVDADGVLAGAACATTPSTRPAIRARRRAARAGGGGAPRAARAARLRGHRPRLALRRAGRWRSR